MARRLWTLGALAICTTVIGMSYAATAQGAVREAHPSAGLSSANHPSVTQKHKMSYHKEWTWKSTKIGRCTVFRVSGFFKYTTVTGVHNVQYKHQVLNSPRLTAYTYVLKNGRCGGSVNVSKFHIGQHWTGYSCSYNPHISVTASITGLSVGVSAWPSCGDRNQAVYSTPYGAGHFAIQDNSGSPVSFGDVTSFGSPTTAPPPVCYGVYPSAQIWKNRHHSDSYGAGNLHAAGKVCLQRP